MPVIWCSISGHGFGHGAQIVPVLNELGKRVPNLRVLLRTSIPKTFFQETLSIPWEHSVSAQDIGCIQDGPLFIDVSKTWEAYEQLHKNWNARMKEEVTAIRAVKPDLVLSNISYLGLAAGVAADCQTVALGSLSWDQILTEYIINGSAKQKKIVNEIRQAYGETRLLIRPLPGIPMIAFREVRDVGPLLSPPVSPQRTIRRRLQVDPQERVVLVAFGGIPLSFLPLDQLEMLTGYRFVISGNFDCRGYSRVVSTNEFGLPFRQFLAEADVVMTKPGYATIVEVVRLQKPLVYVRRYNFADEQPLVDFAHRYGRARELSLREFESGQWHDALEQVLMLPRSSNPMPAEGTGEAADQLAKILK